MNDITRKHNKVLKTERIVNRWLVCHTQLNLKQEIAYNLIIRAINLEKGELKTNGEDDMSCL